MIKNKGIFLLSLLILARTAFPEEPSSVSEQVTLQEQDDRFAHLSAEEKELMLAQMSLIEKAYESFLTQTFEKLDRVYAVGSILSGMIMSDQVPTVINKGETHSKIKSLNMMINSLRNQKMMVINPVEVIGLMKITKAFALHINKALDNNLKSFEDFDVKPVMMALQGITEADLNPQAVAKELEVIERIIKKMEYKSETVGLAWYNKFYRGIVNSTVIQTSNKYGLHKWIPLAYGAIVLGYWILGSAQKSTTDVKVLNGTPVKYEDYIEGSSAFEQTRLIPGFLKRFLGPLPLRQGLHATPENYSSLSVGGILENGISTLNSGALPISAAVAGYAGTKAYQVWSQSISPWASKKLNYVHNFLKGGVYLKKANRISGVTEEVYFDDLVGLNHVKEAFTKIVHYLENPEYYARRGLAPAKGYILVGGTRTGKSHSVKALFNEIKKAQMEKGITEDFKLHVLSGSDIHANGGFARVMRIAQYQAPCVLFIDEIDLLCLQRSGENPMLGEFLTCLSGALTNEDPKKQVIVIAATNNPENLDKALLASGRLSKELRYELPSHEDRVLFLEKQLEKLSLDKEEFDVVGIANQTDGRSYETLKEMINSATLFAAINGRVVTQQDIMLVLDQELRKVVTIDNRIIPQEEKMIIASHFAGPALYLGLANSRIRIAQATTRQVMTAIAERFIGSHLIKDETNAADEKRFEYGAFFTYQVGDTGNVLSYEEKKQLCAMHLSGFIAEEVLLGACGYSCHKSSMNYAMNIAKSLAFEGVDADKLPDDIRTEYHRKAFRIVEECKNELRSLFKEHKAQLELIRNELFKKEVLQESDILTLLAQEENAEGSTETVVE